MKVSELLLESDPFTYMKGLQKEFKEIANAEGFTIVAGMGWPAFVKDGTWFGGGLKPMGRKKKDEIVSIDDLPPEAQKKYMQARVKVFVHHLAAKLEQLAKSGHAIKIAPGATRGKGSFDGKPGELEKQLMDAVVMAAPPGNVSSKAHLPCVAWFVGQPAEYAGQTAVRGTFNIYSDEREENTFSNGQKWMSDKRYGYEFGSTMSVEEAKVFEKKWKIWTKANSGTSYGKDQKPATKAYFDLMWRAVKLAGKYGKEVPQNLKKDHPGWAGLSVKVLSKATIRVTPEEFRELYKGII